jgi:Smg protein
MKQTVVDVLMYLFENMIDEETSFDPERDQIVDHLEELGFPQHEILHAFDWLEDLADLQLHAIENDSLTSSLRVYSELEKMLLDAECIGFLIYMEQSGILTPATRELILDRVISLDVELDIEQLKWIAMIILHSHPGEENAFARIESMVFDQVLDYMH